MRVKMTVSVPALSPIADDAAPAAACGLAGIAGTLLRSLPAGASVEVAVPAADHPVATVTSSGQVHAAVVLSGKAGTADGLAWLGVPARPAAEAGVRVAADPRVGA